MTKKIQGTPGVPGGIAILKVAVNPERFKAIGRFKMSNGKYQYIAITITPDLLGKPDKIKRYYNNNYKLRGDYVEHSKWVQATKSSETQSYNEQRTGKDIHFYSSEIARDISKHSPAKLKKLIRQEEKNHIVFMAQMEGMSTKEAEALVK